MKRILSMMTALLLQSACLAGAGAEGAVWVPR